MSTIASPRQSSIRSPTPSSGRPSFDTTRTNSPSRPPTHQPPVPRRNRAALRDYYNLKSAAPANVSSSQQHEDADSAPSELDSASFDAEAYVAKILETESLDGVLRVESGLVGEIRGLDGEKKALVYDNYSKLIAATDTIRKMRTEMEPLTPTTATLGPAVSHIAETSQALAVAMKEAQGKKARKTVTAEDRQKQTVRWVLDAPTRIRKKVDAGKRQEAEDDWKDVSGLLNRWEGVEGVDEIRQGCEKALSLVE